MEFPNFKDKQASSLLSKWTVSVKFKSVSFNVKTWKTYIEKTSFLFLKKAKFEKKKKVELIQKSSKKEQYRQGKA